MHHVGNQEQTDMQNNTLALSSRMNPQMLRSQRERECLLDSAEACRWGFINQMQMYAYVCHILAYPVLKCIFELPSWVLYIGTILFNEDKLLSWMSADACGTPDIERSLQQWLLWKEYLDSSYYYKGISSTKLGSWKFCPLEMLRLQTSVIIDYEVSNTPILVF